MSNWLVTLTYEKEKTSGGNFLKGISSTTVNYTTSKTCFVKFKGNYPTETEIKDLIKSKPLIVDEYIGFDGERYEIKNYPTITFMQKLEEEVEE